MSFTLQSWISPWFLYSKTCIYLPQSCRSPLSNATACSHSSIACWCSSYIVSTHFLFWIEQQFRLYRQGRWKYHVDFVSPPNIPKLQSLAKYLRLTLVFMWNSALRKSSISVFQKIFTSTDKIFISWEGLSTRQYSMKFWDFSDLS